MSNASQVIDFQKYIFDKDVDTRIKQNRDDMLGIIRVDIKELHSDLKVHEAKVEADIKALDAKVDSNFEILNTKIEGIHASIKQGKNLSKWIVGMLVTLILGLAGLAVPVIFMLAN